MKEMKTSVSLIRDSVDRIGPYLVHPSVPSHEMVSASSGNRRSCSAKKGFYGIDRLRKLSWVVRPTGIEDPKR